MIFFTGMHHPSDAAKVRAAFISVHALSRRRSGFPARRWIMDSGAFRTIHMHGGYPEPVEAYAAHIRRFARNGRMLAAVAQDYMCEPHMLARTGLTIADHQRMTIERYDALLTCDTAGIRIMPVLQGYAPADYVSHIRQYGARLKHRMWVGVGSICKRNSRPGAIEAILLAIKAERPDLRLHGFGIKKTSLGSQLVRDNLFSADSMAWSFGARYAGRNANDPSEAVRYARQIAVMPVQLHLLTRLIVAAAFLATIPVTNWMIGHVGVCVQPVLCVISVAPGLRAPSGVLTVGAAFVLRDLLQIIAGRTWILCCIALGAIISAWLAPAALVVASAVAFSLGELSDWAVFSPLWRRSFVAAALLAAIAAGVVDSAIFLGIAFGSLTYLPGQVVGKLWGTLAVLPIVYSIRYRRPLLCLFGFHDKYIQSDYGYAWATACRYCKWRVSSGNPMP